MLFQFSTGKEVLLDYDEFEVMTKAVEECCMKHTYSVLKSAADSGGEELWVVESGLTPRRGVERRQGVEAGGLGQERVLGRQLLYLLSGGGMKCQNCSSERVVHCGGHCQDRFNLTAYANYEGYVPYGLNMGGGDYVELKVCFDCGRLQGEWPVTDAALRKSLEEAR